MGKILYVAKHREVPKWDREHEILDFSFFFLFFFPFFP